MAKIKHIVQLFIMSHLFIFISCDKSNYRPGNKFLYSDMVISSSKHFLKEETDFSVYIEETISVFSKIEALTVADSENLFLLSTFGEIIKINNKGKPLLKIESYGQGPGEMMMPLDIKVRNNKLYIMDIGNNKIVIYNLSGSWLNDVVIHDVNLKTFEVNSNENIIVPVLSFLKNSKIPLFIIYNDKGEVVDKISKNNFIKEDIIQTPPRLLLFLTPNSYLLLVFEIQGVFYLFNFEGELVSKFDIHGGPEWKQSVEFEKRLEKNSKYGKSWPHRVENVSFDSNGNIYATWGGNFKGQKSIIMIYDSEGCFVGRLYGNEDFPYAPTCFELENDSTAWIYSREMYTFAKCKIAYRKNE